jgi:hypothetical protein
MEAFGDPTESTVTAMDLIQLSLIFIRSAFKIRTFSYFHQASVQNKMVFIDVGCSLCELKLRGTIAHSNFLLFSSGLHSK